MSLINTGDKIITWIIISVFILGIIETTALVPTDVPWYQEIGSDVMSGDPIKIIDLVKMGISWGVITSTIHVSQLPVWLQWYGWYFSLFVPEGYLPMPGIETVIYVFIVMLLVTLPLALYTKSQMKKKKQGKQDLQILGLPWWFYLSIPLALMALYPLWVWFNIWLFAYGFAGFFNTTPEAGRVMWLTLSQNTESFSVFFVITGALGLYKTIIWSKRGKIGF